MQLDLLIKSGARNGHRIQLSEAGALKESAPWIKENEALEISLSTPSQFYKATLVLYDHKTETTEVITKENCTTFIWKPKTLQNNRLDCLFINYFGLAEISIELEDEDGNKLIKHFIPLEVFASKANANNVEKMLFFLSSLGDEQLHSLFQTTKHGAGFTDGSNTPKGNLERLELTLQKLTYLIQELTARPITKLLPEQQVIQAIGEEAFDDQALGWLLNNLSVLDPTDDIDRSHIKYNNGYYKASSVQMPVLKENSNLYENQVVHGFISVLISEAKSQLNQYTFNDKTLSKNKNTVPEGYSSFFNQVSRFKNNLLGNQIAKCINIIDKLTALKHQLENTIPVCRDIIKRPILTPKATSHFAYRCIFIEFIEWFEKSTPDWSLYHNLLAIESIPILFESYCYYRVCLALNSLLKLDSNLSLSTLLTDANGAEVYLEREPTYWMPLHHNSAENEFINSEGKTVRHHKVKDRSHTTRFSHRRPDIVIEVRQEKKPPRLIIMDAKYTYPSLAFEKYLPECTMKYVHGIHNNHNCLNPVQSLTIIHPDSLTKFESFHSQDYSLKGKYPIAPSLQTLGVALEGNEIEDELLNILELLLVQAGVEIKKQHELAFG